MILCGGSCHQICDFCIYFKMYIEDDLPTGEGYCRKHNKEVELTSYCDDYHCFRVNSENIE